VRFIGLCLVAVGVVILAYHGYMLVIPQTAVDVGPVKVSVDQQHSYWISPTIGGITCAVGLALILLGGRRRIC